MRGVGRVLLAAPHHHDGRAPPYADRENAHDAVIRRTRKPQQPLAAMCWRTKRIGACGGRPDEWPADRPAQIRVDCFIVAGDNLGRTAPERRSIGRHRQQERNEADNRNDELSGPDVCIHMHEL